MTSDRFHHVITVNSLLVLDVKKNPSLKSICDDASLLIPDSSGFVWANSVLNHIKLDRYPGIDLAFDLCAKAAEKNIPVFLLGGKPGIVEDAKQFLIGHFPSIRIAGCRDGYFSDRDSTSITEEICNLASGAPMLILVAMGMPRQESWIYENRRNLPAGLAVGVGGTFDVWAGVTARAPQFLQKLGLEWLYRLFQEPFRWKRIMMLPCFVLLVLKSRISNPSGIR